jgi:hypothetical protein
MHQRALIALLVFKKGNKVNLFPRRAVLIETKTTHQRLCTEFTFKCLFFHIANFILEA